MRYLHIFFLPVLLLLSSCSKDPVPANDNLIGVTKCKTYQRGGKSITCCLDSVLQDSRCPARALCIWQGMVVTRFTVSTSSSDHVITLSTLKFPPYAKDTLVAGFKIELLNVLPSPELDKPFNYKDYVAEVNITHP